MRTTSGMEIALRVCFAGVLAGASGAAYVGCFCGGCDCGGGDAAPQTFDIAFRTTCPDDSGIEASVSDAAVDASDDGGDAQTVADAGSPDANADDGGLPCFATCQEACSALQPASTTGSGVCMFSDAGADGATTAHCQSVIFCGGRKFDGLDAPLIEGDALAAWIARMAWLEAASVHAFRRLARELVAHGAPEELVRQARSCARDEIRHARTMTKLAAKHGVKVPPVTASRASIRDLESVAHENAVEGCVGETFGALYAAWQATAARDPELAAAMGAIAPDELRHAAFGWAVASWIDTKLDDSARIRVRRARSSAARDLVTNARDPHERALAMGLMTQLWAA